MAVCIKLCAKVTIKLGWRDIVIYVTVVTVIMATSVMLVEHLDSGDDGARPVSIILLPLDVGLAVLIVMCIVLCCCCSVRREGRGGGGIVGGSRSRGGGGGGTATKSLREPLRDGDNEVEDLGLPAVPTHPLVLADDTDVPL
jgi:uncharacterized membrane protein YgcG